MAVSIVIEYKKLLDRKQKISSELAMLPRGYISKKVIKGKTYYYLQNRTSGKHTSFYLKNDVVEDIRGQLLLRKRHETDLPGILRRLEELEQAAKLIDRQIYRQLMLFRVSSGMDELDSDQREKSTSFAGAMNAMEGIGVSEMTEKDISEWKQGNISFLQIYQSTLQRYGFTRKVKHA